MLTDWLVSKVERRYEKSNGDFVAVAVPTDQKKGVRAAQKEARPKEIVEAALQVFARDGFAGTRLEDVAEQVGISKGTIYLYFENKEELFKACVRETVGADSAVTEEFTAHFEGHTSDLLREIVKLISARFSNDNFRTILLLLISEGQRFPELVSFYYEEILSPRMEGLRAVIARGVERKEFRDTGLVDYPMLLMSPVMASVVWNHMFGKWEALDLSKLLNTHLETVLEGLQV